MRTTPWCIMPWTYLEILTTGDVTPCCASYYLYGNVKEKSVDEIWNDDPIKQLRLDMFKDEMPEACRVCKEIEETGSECSLRIANNEKLKSTFDDIQNITNEDGSISELKFRGWDFKLKNKCNFRCRTCTPWESELIAKENKEIVDRKDHFISVKGSFDSDDVPTLENTCQSVTDYFDFRQFAIDQIDNLEMIEFAGGETLIMDEHYELLDILLDHNKTDIHLSYNTNMSIMKYKSYHVLDYWRKWNPEKLTVIASIDEIEKRAEHIRKGTVWNVVQKNLKIIVSEGFNRKTNSVIGCHNVFRLPELITYLTEMDYISPKFNCLNFDLSVEICNYDLRALSDEFKTDIVIKIENFIKNYNEAYKTDITSKFVHVIETLKEPHHIKYALRYFKETIKRDKFRGENTFEVIPEMKDIKRSIKKYKEQYNVK